MTTTLTLTDNGEAMTAYLWKGDQATKGYVTHMAVGTGAAPGEIGNAHTTEIARKTVTAMVSTGAGTNANKVTFEMTLLTTEGNGTITEVALMTAASGGNMAAVASISPGVTKSDQFNLKFSWEVPFE